MVRIIAHSRKGGCHRFLSASPNCDTDDVLLAIEDDGSKRQRWVLMKDSYVDPSPSPENNPTPTPTSSPTPSPTPILTPVLTPTPTPPTPFMAPNYPDPFDNGEFCDGWGEIIVQTHCVCDARNGFTSNGLGGCACDAKRGLKSDGTTGCICNSEEGLISDATGACVCNNAKGYFFADDGSCSKRFFVYTDFVNGFRGYLRMSSQDELFVAFIDQPIEGSLLVAHESSPGSWSLLGETGFSPPVAGFGLGLDETDRPTVAFAYSDNFRPMTAMRWSGSAWNMVGNTNFSNMSIGADINVAPLSNGEVYVQTDGGFFGGTAKWWFDGEAWTYFEATSWAGVAPLVGSLAVFDGNAYSTFGSSIGPSFNDPVFTAIEMLNKSSREFVGVFGYTIVDGINCPTNLVFGSDGTPYVLLHYFFGAYNGFVSVVKYNGSEWVHVGDPEVFRGSCTGLSYVGDGELYMLCWPNSGLTPERYLTLMKYDGNSWGVVGYPNFAASFSFPSASLAFDSAGQPYIGFTQPNLTFAIMSYPI